MKIWLSLFITLIFSVFFPFHLQAKNVSLRMSFPELEKFAENLKKPILVEINPGPVVLLSEANDIRQISLKGITHRIFVAQKICEPSLPLEFPDGSQGVIVCWLKK